MNTRDEIRKSLGVGGVFGTLRAVVELLRTIDDPSKSNIRYGISRLRHQAVTSAAVGLADELAERSPQLQRLYRDSYDPPVDIKALGELPASTLGGAFARFLADNGIDPLQDQLNDPDTARNAFEYTVLRAYKLHDVMHVVLDCDTTVFGEVKIVAFSIGQTDRLGVQLPHRAPVVTLGVLFLHIAMYEPAELIPAMRTALEWYQKGLDCQPMVQFQFEEHWNRPLADIREMLVPAGAQSKRSA